MTPTTIRALRAAVERVLVAHGDPPDAALVLAPPDRGGRVVHLLAACLAGRWLAMYLSRATRADAIAATWAAVVERCAEADARSTHDLAVAQVARLRAAAALRATTTTATTKRSER